MPECRSHSDSTKHSVMSHIQSPLLENTDPKALLNRWSTSHPTINLTDDIFEESTYIYGHGGYGDVYRAKSRRHEDMYMYVAVKRTRVDNFPQEHQGLKARETFIDWIRRSLNTKASIIQSIYRELSIWASVQHPNILPLLGYTLSKKYPSPVSPWIEKGTVRKYMDRHGGDPMLHLVSSLLSYHTWRHNV